MTGRQEAEIVGYPVATRWPWSADVDYMEATARQYDEDKTEANRNAFLWASLRNDMDAGCVAEGAHSHPTAPPRIGRQRP